MRRGNPLPDSNGLVWRGARGPAGAKKAEAADVALTQTRDDARLQGNPAMGPVPDLPGAGSRKFPTVFFARCPGLIRAAALTDATPHHGTNTPARRKVVSSPSPQVGGQLA
jgi:hypothetical protein